MPAHNAAQYIASAIDSVLAQTHSNLQLLIVDDASSDATVEIINSFVEQDSRVVLFSLKTQSGGPAAPRNRALQNANGEFVAFIDADDMWRKDKLSCQLKAMQVHSLDFCSTRHIKFVDFIDESKDVEATISGILEDPPISLISHQQMLRKNRIVCSGVLLSSALAQDLVFSEQAENVGIEDYLAWLTILQKHTVGAAIIDLPLVFYRLRNDSLSNSKINMAKKIFGLLSRYTQNGKPLGIRKYFYFAHYGVAGLKMLLIDRLKK